MGRLLGLFWERFSCSWEEVVSGLPLDVTPGTASATLHETSLQISEQRDSRNLGSRWPGGPAKSTSPKIPPTSGLPVERGLTFPASLSHFSPGFLLLGPMPWWTGAPFGLVNLFCLNGPGQKLRGSQICSPRMVESLKYSTQSSASCLVEEPPPAHGTKDSRPQ